MSPGRPAALGRTRRLRAIAVLAVLAFPLEIALGLLPSAWALSVTAVAPVDYRGDFEQPSAVVADQKGRIYVLDGARHRIVVLTGEGKPIGSFGREGRGVGELHLPLDLHLAEEGLIVADTGNHRLVSFDTSGRFLRFWPLPRGPRGVAMESSPEANGEGEPAEPVAVTVREGIAWWADRRAHRICRLRLADGKGLGCFGERGEGVGQFQYPFQIVPDRDGYFHVLDILNARVQVFDRGGRFFSQTGRFGFAPGELFRPSGLALDAERDLAFIADGYFGTIAVFRRGEFQGLLSADSGEPLRLDSPTGLHFNGGFLYVAETGANRVLRYALRYEEGKSNPPAVRGDGDPSRKNCLTCHLSWADVASPSIRAPDPQGALPEASFRMCYSCHNGAVMDSRLFIHRGAQHPVIYESAREKERHAKMQPRRDELPEVFPRTPDEQLLCTSCHTPHTDANQPRALYAGHENAWLRVPNRQGELCERCHVSKSKSARVGLPATFAPSDDAGRQGPKGRNHPLGIRFQPPPYADAKGYPTNQELHRGLPETLQARGGALGPKKELVCQSCHQIHGGHKEGELTVLPNDHGELCAVCHPRQFSKSREEAHAKGIHPINVGREPDAAGQPPVLWKGKPGITKVTCQTCHRVHAGNPETPLLPEGIAEAEALCQNCHERQHAEDEVEARQKGVHPVNVMLDKPVRIGAREIRKVGCLTCHAVHRGKPNTAALVENDREGELCSHCHRHKQTVVGTDHDLRITAKDKKNALDQLPSESGVCGACHSMHRGKGERPFLFASRKITPPVEANAGEMDETPFARDRLCLGCHQKGGLAEKKVVTHFGHPFRDLILRAEEQHMPLLDPREKPQRFGRIACITCHEPHLWDADEKPPAVAKMTVSSNTENREGTNRNSFLRVEEVDHTFCVSCHGLETLIKYKYYHDEKRARNRGLRYLE